MPGGKRESRRLPPPLRCASEETDEAVSLLAGGFLSLMPVLLNDSLCLSLSDTNTQTQTQTHTHTCRAASRALMHFSITVVTRFNNNKNRQGLLDEKGTRVRPPPSLPAFYHRAESQEPQGTRLHPIPHFPPQGEQPLLGETASLRYTWYEKSALSPKECVT